MSVPEILLSQFKETSVHCLVETGNKAVATKNAISSVNSILCGDALCILLPRQELKCRLGYG